MRGVTLCKKRNRSGRVSSEYKAHWVNPLGVRKFTSFSIKKYGEPLAFHLAVLSRRQQFRENFTLIDPSKV